MGQKLRLLYGTVCTQLQLLQYCLLQIGGWLRVDVKVLELHVSSRAAQRGYSEHELKLLLLLSLHPTSR